MTDSFTAGPPSIADCPFCGRPPEIIWRKHNPRSACKTADCWGSKCPSVALDDPEQVVAWNTRPAGRLVAVRDAVGMLRCPYCAQPDAEWLDKDLARGRRDGAGYVQYHCYSAKCWD